MVADLPFATNASAYKPVAATVTVCVPTNPAEIAPGVTAPETADLSYTLEAIVAAAIVNAF